MVVSERESNDTFSLPIDGVNVVPVAGLSILHVSIQRTKEARSEKVTIRLAVRVILTPMYVCAP